MASTSSKSVRQEGVGWSALLEGGRLRAFVERMFPLAQRARLMRTPGKAATAARRCSGW